MAVVKILFGPMWFCFSFAAVLRVATGKIRCTSIILYIASLLSNSSDAGRAWLGEQCGWSGAQRFSFVLRGPRDFTCSARGVRGGISSNLFSSVRGTTQALTLRETVSWRRSDLLRSGGGEVGRVFRVTFMQHRTRWEGKVGGGQQTPADCRSTSRVH